MYSFGILIKANVHRNNIPIYYNYVIQIKTSNGKDVKIRGEPSTYRQVLDQFTSLFYKMESKLRMNTNQRGVRIVSTSKHNVNKGRKRRKSSTFANSCRRK